MKSQQQNHITITIQNNRTIVEAKGVFYQDLTDISGFKSTENPPLHQIETHEGPCLFTERLSSDLDIRIRIRVRIYSLARRICCEIF